MSDTMREKIIDQIKKMQAIADNAAAAPNEREFALARIAKLLKQHSIVDDEIVEKKRLSVILELASPQQVGWIDLFFSAISVQYGCSTAVMLYDDGAHKTFDRIVLVGEKLDVEVCLPIMQTLVVQVQERADQLYDWATKRHAELWDEKDRTLREMFGETTSSNATGTYNFFSFISFSMNASLKTALLKDREMLDRKSPTWESIEKSWGLGLIASLVERIINLSNQEDDFDKEHASAFLASERHRIAGHFRPGTSLAVVSTALTMQNVLKEKNNENMKSLKKIGGERYRDITPPKDQTRIEYPDMFEQGQREGREVELSDGKKTDDAKH